MSSNTCSFYTQNSNHIHRKEGYNGYDKKINGKNGISYKITVSLGRNLEDKQIRKHTTYVPEMYTKTGKHRSEKVIMQDVEAYAKQFELECRSGKMADK